LTRARFGGQDEPFGSADLTALRRSGELIDALAARRAVLPATPHARPGERDDPVIGLLQALVSDVDRGAPPLCSRTVRSRPDRVQPGWLRVDTIHGEPVPARMATLRGEAPLGEAAGSGAARSGAGGSGTGAGGTGAGGAIRRGGGRSPRRPSRRGAHTLIALSVAATMFTTTGVAAAGGIISHAERKTEARPAHVVVPTPREPRQGAGVDRPEGRRPVTGARRTGAQRPDRAARADGAGQDLVAEGKSSPRETRSDRAEPPEAPKTPTPTPPRGSSPSPDRRESAVDPDAGDTSPSGDGRYANGQPIPGDGQDRPEPSG
jgi:hypothetical protein